MILSSSLLSSSLYLTPWPFNSHFSILLCVLNCSQCHPCFFPSCQNSILVTIASYLILTLSYLFSNVNRICCQPQKHLLERFISIHAILIAVFRNGGNKYGITISAVKHIRNCASDSSQTRCFQNVQIKLSKVLQPCHQIPSETTM